MLVGAFSGRKRVGGRLVFGAGIQSVLIYFFWSFRVLADKLFLLKILFS